MAVDPIDERAHATFTGTLRRFHRLWHCQDYQVCGRVILSRMDVRAAKT